MISNSHDAPALRIPHDVLTGFLENIFAAAGCTTANAQLMAAGVVEADLKGHKIQGLDHIYSTLRDLRSGVLNGQAMPCVTSESGATVRVDGQGCPGHVGGMFATEQAIRKAKEAGAAVVALVDSGDIFMLGYYAEMMATADLAGLVLTNTWPARCHPVGGIDRILGTNPLAVGIPVAGEPPVVLDFATSASAIGHLRMASYYDAPIAQGIAIDSAGVPTTSAKAGLDGALSPLGGHKGYGLGLCVGLLSGPVIGGVLGAALDAVAGKGDSGAGKRSHLFMAINPAAFGDLGIAKHAVSAYLAEIRGGRKAEGVDRIFTPGEGSAMRRSENIRRGVPVSQAVWDRATAFAKELSVAIPGIKQEWKCE
jgi:LDH2 family malate/lactate/ureidoglycolate dehydrogenase